jgi:hypothetical protein
VFGYLAPKCPTRYVPEVFLVQEADVEKTVNIFRGLEHPAALQKLLDTVQKTTSKENIHHEENSSPCIVSAATTFDSEEKYDDKESCLLLPSVKCDGLELQKGPSALKLLSRALVLVKELPSLLFCVFELSSS